MAKPAAGTWICRGLAASMAAVLLQAPSVPASAQTPAADPAPAAASPGDAAALAAGNRGALQSDAAAQAAHELALRAGALRMFGPFQPDRPYARFSQAELNAAATIFADPSDPERVLVTRFLIPARQYVLVDGETGVTGWWSPFADMWIVGVWRRTGEGWELTRLTPMLPEDFDREAGGLTASGLVSERAFRAFDQRRVQMFRSASALGTLAALQLPGQRIGHNRSELLRRQTILLLGLREVSARPGFQGLETVAQQPLPDTRSTRRALRALPTEVRRSLVLVQAFRARSGFTIAAVSPFAPGLVVLINMTQTSAAQPAGITAVHFLSL